MMNINGPLVAVITILLIIGLVWSVAIGLF
jgi:hypothetical protein